MNVFNFTAHFGSEEACRIHFKQERDKIGVECNAVLKNIFGYKTVGVINVKSVEVEFHYEAEKSCMVKTYPF